MPLADVITPATAPCSASGTASDAPAVKPGRVKPKPHDATAKPIVIPYKSLDNIVPNSPAAAISAPHRINAWGLRPRRGISPHCAPSVAPAPAIITIEIGPSEPDAVRCSRSITKKPIQVKVAACAWPATTPAVIHGRIRGSFQLSLLWWRGAGASVTPAPRGGPASRGSGPPAP